MVNSHGLEIPQHNSFGDAGIVHTDSSVNDENFWQEAAIKLGYADGCPIAESLIERDGAEAMAIEYAETNFWFRWAVSKIATKKPEIAEFLLSTQPRGEEEPIAIFDEVSVPESIFTQIHGLNHPTAYSISQIILAFLKREDAHQNMLNDIEIIEHVFNEILDSHKGSVRVKDATDFAIQLAERLSFINVGIDKSARILRHLVPQSILDSDNCFKLYADIFTRIFTREGYATNLRGALIRMSHEEVAKYGLADYEKFIKLD